MPRSSTPAPEPTELFKVREAFAVPGEGGYLRPYITGALLRGDDPLVKTHRALLEPAAGAVEKATAEPGERRTLGLRLPSAVTQAQAVQHRTGSAHDTALALVRVPTTPEGVPMVHALPPEHPDSPASPFAPAQPAAGVVADDADERGQNLAGAPKAADVADATIEVSEGVVKVPDVEKAARQAQSKK